MGHGQSGELWGMDSQRFLASLLCSIPQHIERYVGTHTGIDLFTPNGQLSTFGTTIKPRERLLTDLVAPPVSERLSDVGCRMSDASRTVGRGSEVSGACCRRFRKVPEGSRRFFAARVVRHKMGVEHRRTLVMETGFASLCHWCSS